jgi:GNAT superfamily N-acetyltransferase
MFVMKELLGNEIIDYVDILHERYKWMISHEIFMWEFKYLELNGMIKRYEEPLFYGAYEDKECVGGFVLIEKDDRYWPRNVKDKAYYLHKFVVSPKYSKMDYSHKMLEWVKQYGNEKGKKYIRLDYEKSRTYLRNMYLEHGFEDISEMKTDEGAILILGEYKIVASE